MMRFETMLSLATIISGVVYLWYLVQERRKRTTNVQLIAGNGLASRFANKFLEFCRTTFPVFIFVLVLRSFAYEPFRIPSGSMKPTLLVGDLVLVNKYAYGLRLPVLGTKLIPVSEPKTGDIVVFRHKDGSQDLIKRVIGVPGDHIRYVDKQLYINDQLVSTEFVGPNTESGAYVMQNTEFLPNMTHSILIDPERSDGSDFKYNDVLVPPNSYFVMGDNRDDSSDGRVFGFVSDKDLLGKAVITWMSFGKNGQSSLVPVRWSRIGRSVYVDPTESK